VAATFEPATEILYVSDFDADHIVPVAVATRQVGRPIQAGDGPSTLRLTPGGDILLVIDTNSDDLAAIRTKILPTGQASLSPPRPPTGLIPLGGSPRDLATKVF
jgi:hypothetical protein